MSANKRIQWLHKKISENCYPGISHLTEKFSISRRQAQRDVDYLRHELGAPVAYSSAHKGYYYTEEYIIPLALQAENDADFQDVVSGLRNFTSIGAERSVTQLQFPYSATLEIKDKMTVLNLRSLIVADERHHRYRCEFSSVELFLGVIMSTGGNVRVVEPLWLRERLMQTANRVLEANRAEESEQGSVSAHGKRK